MYGGLREAEIAAFLQSNIRPPHIRGLMGFFPLNTDIQQMKMLDGWLLNIFSRAQRERVRVIAALGYSSKILSRNSLIDGSWYHYSGVNNDATLPSFVRAWRVSRKYYFRYGLSQIQAPSYYSTLSYD
jgi:hypothetical protein